MAEENNIMYPVIITLITDDLTKTQNYISTFQQLIEQSPKLNTYFNTSKSK